MRALNEWLKAVRADGLVLVRTRVAGPWGFEVPSRDAVVFHFAAEGRALCARPTRNPCESGHSPEAGPSGRSGSRVRIRPR
ncbi:cupin domain-containing protein [Trinickia sp. YCB016]